MSERDVPSGVTVEWSEALAAEAYRVASPRRLAALTVRPGRRGLAVAGTAGVGGATGAALLFEHGLSHARGFVTLMGISLAVIAGVLLDRLAPRFMNRTELRFKDDALECAQLPLGDRRPLRLLVREIQRFELEVVADPLAAPASVVFQINARKTDGTLEPLILAVDERATADWLLRVLSERHAL
ncbi:MAG: hypothetical protein U0325_34985 [Polyangiales bacterium]